MELREARQHHYAFVHQLLRSLFFGDTEETLEHFRMEGESALLALWDFVEKRLELDDPVSSEGLALEWVPLVSGMTMVLITLPAPEAITEAYYVGLVYSPLDSTGRFIVLEHTVDLDGRARTVLCEWSPDGTHFNLGEGPDPSPEAFTDAVEMLLAATTGPPEWDESEPLDEEEM